MKFTDGNRRGHMVYVSPQRCDVLRHCCSCVAAPSEVPRGRCSVAIAHDSVCMQFVYRTDVQGVTLSVRVGTDNRVALTENLKEKLRLDTVKQ